jgi:hypothetical protein
LAARGANAAVDQGVGRPVDYDDWPDVDAEAVTQMSSMPETEEQRRRNGARWALVAALAAAPAGGVRGDGGR